MGLGASPRGDRDVRLGSASTRTPTGKPAGLATRTSALPRRPRRGHIYLAILRDEPLRAVTLTLLLEALAEHCGGDLLRLKGIVNVAESPDRPAVIHGVQHVFHPPTWLDRWPSGDRRTRLVFIVRDIPQAWIEALIAALEAEVEEVASNIVPA